jgi:hypothetical protein
MEGGSILCLSHLGSASPTRLRLLSRRLRRRSAADARIVLGLWSGVPHALRPNALEALGIIATSLSEAVDRISEELSVPAATDARRSA